MKRQVTITIGVPDSLREANDAEGPDPMEDCYCANFEQVCEDGEVEGFTIQASCLCWLPMATEAWIVGMVSADEIQEMLRSHDHKPPRKRSKKRRKKK